MVEDQLFRVANGLGSLEPRTATANSAALAVTATLAPPVPDSVSSTDIHFLVLHDPPDRVDSEAHERTTPQLGAPLLSRLIRIEVSSDREAEEAEQNRGRGRQAKQRPAGHPTEAGTNHPVADLRSAPAIP